MILASRKRIERLCGIIVFRSIIEVIYVNTKGFKYNACFIIDRDTR